VPQCFEDFDQLAILDQNFAFADRLRKIWSPESTLKVHESNVQVSRVQATRPSVREVKSSPGRAKACFFCHRAGHLKMDCFRWQDQLRNLAQGTQAVPFD
jgi:hypothetical protein